MAWTKYFFATALMIAACNATAGEAISWPGGARVAVSLSYDDALDSQLDHALPALDRHGLKATFYLALGSESLRVRLPEWRAAASRGHELGNHTIYHPCQASKPGREWVEPHNDLDRQSVAQLRREIVIANTFLHAIDGTERRSYAATCYDQLAGGEPYLEAIEDLFGGIRDLDHGMAPGTRIIWGPSDESTSGEDLIRFVRENTKDGHMLGIVFHGVGGDYLSVSAAAHEELLEYLADNPDTYWVETYLNIADHVRRHLGNDPDR